MRKIHSFDEVFDAQRVFRGILDSMSRPGEFFDMGEYAGKLPGPHPLLLAVALTLLDASVSFCSDDDDLASDIASLTLSRPSAPEAADFLFVCAASALEAAVSRAKCGTLLDPHKSATIIVSAGAGQNARLRLRGPGVAGLAEVMAPEAVQKALGLRDGRRLEYPQGIDFIFLSGGRLFCVPRLVKWEVA